MAAQLLTGTELAAATVEGVAERADRFRDRTGRAPCLATVLVGDDPASAAYIHLKALRCSRAGITSRRVHLDADTPERDLTGRIRALSADPEVDGILVQHPVPAPLDVRAAFEAVDPAKDVDGVTSCSFAAMALGRSGRAPGSGEAGFVAATPGGIMRLLDHHLDAKALTGLHAVVIGRSPILGLPLAQLLLGRDATVTQAHSKSTHLADLVRSADLVVASCGVPQLVRGDWIKPGAIVVDAGYHPGPHVGDVAFDEAVHRAAWITPVPGGVGPMTIAVLLEQTVTAAEKRVLPSPA
jgi:methylenetetrahydrofolate dehydrogenase (NADP+)/methenyltetrahydrofolate cyclohydrolase